ncbi:hypothetical protein BDZ97DRAFT_267332 [Flammula alnicola]|nr:hypothetical protein BDZ97DRAFT_267332 [Flammula alnicola]
MDILDYNVTDNAGLEPLFFLPYSFFSDFLKVDAFVLLRPLTKLTMLRMFFTDYIIDFVSTDFFYGYAVFGISCLFSSNNVDCCCTNFGFLSPIK